MSKIDDLFEQLESISPMAKYDAQHLRNWLQVEERIGTAYAFVRNVLHGIVLIALLFSLMSLAVRFWNIFQNVNNPSVNMWLIVATLSAWFALITPILLDSILILWTRLQYKVQLSIRLDKHGWHFDIAPLERTFYERLYLWLKLLPEHTERDQHNMERLEQVVKRLHIVQTWQTIVSGLGQVLFNVFLITMLLLLLSLFVPELNTRLSFTWVVLSFVSYCGTALVVIGIDTMWVSKWLSGWYSWLLANLKFNSKGEILDGEH